MSHFGTYLEHCEIWCPCHNKWPVIQQKISQWRIIIPELYVLCTYNVHIIWVRGLSSKPPFSTLKMISFLMFEFPILSFLHDWKLRFLHPIKIQIPTLLLHYTHSPYCTFNERVVHSLLEITDTLSNSWKWRMSCCAARSHYSIWLWVCRAAAAPRAASLTDELCIDPIPPTLPFISLYVGTYICGGWLT